MATANRRTLNIVLFSFANIGGNFDINQYNTTEIWYFFIFILLCRYVDIIFLDGCFYT